MTMRGTAHLSTLLAFSAGLLGGCTVSDDPREGGFISGAANLISGGYEQRIESKEQELESQQALQSDLAARAEEIQRKRREVAARLEAAENRMRELERKLEAFRSQLKQETGARATDEAKMQEIEDQLGSLRQSMERANDQQRPVDEALAEMDQIRGVLDSVAELVDQVGAEAFQ